MATGEPQHVMHRNGGLRRLVDASNVKQSRALAKEFTEQLQSNGMVLGFDMEWVPDRCPQHNHKVALVQLAVGGGVWLIRTCNIDLPQFVRDVLLDKKVVKVTADFDSADRAKLSSSFGMTVADNPEENGFLDINILAKACGFQGCGVKKLAQRYGYRISKNHKTSVSDWAAPSLSEKQLQYACDDAYFSLLIALHLLKEDTIVSSLSDFQSHAHRSLEIGLQRATLVLKAEDCALQDAGVESLLVDLCAAVLDNTGSTSGVDIPIEQLGLLSDKEGKRFSARASALGVSLGKKFLLEHRTYVAITSRKNAVFVRVRAIAERAPISKKELAFPWESHLASDTAYVFQSWMAMMKCFVGDDGDADILLTEVELKGRLRLIGYALEERGQILDAKAVQRFADTFSVEKQLLPGGKETMSLTGRTLASESGRPLRKHCTESSPSELHQATQTFDPSRTLVVRKIPKYWDSEALGRAAESALGQVPEDVFMPPASKGSHKNRGFAFLVFAGGSMVTEWLQTPEMMWDGEAVVLSAYAAAD